MALDMNGTAYTAIGLMIGGVITVGVAALISWLKARHEINKESRNGVIGEWKEVTDNLQKSHSECLSRTSKLEAQVDAQRLECISLYTELATLRAQISARETERVTQRSEIRTLEKSVIELKKPDTEAIVESIVPKLTEAMSKLPASSPGTAPTPVTIVQSEEADPVRTEETKRKPKENP